MDVKYMKELHGKKVLVLPHPGEKNNMLIIDKDYETVDGWERGLLIKTPGFMFDGNRVTVYIHNYKFTGRSYSVPKCATEQEIEKLALRYIDKN